MFVFVFECAQLFTEEIYVAFDKHFIDDETHFDYNLEKKTTALSMKYKIGFVNAAKIDDNHNTCV